MPIGPVFSYLPHARTALAVAAAFGAGATFMVWLGSPGIDAASQAPVQLADAACDRQAWPYAETRCLEPSAAQTQRRPVRVVSTERPSESGLDTSAEAEPSPSPARDAPTLAAAGSVEHPASAPPTAAPLHWVAAATSQVPTAQAPELPAVPARATSNAPHRGADNPDASAEEGATRSATAERADEPEPVVSRTVEQREKTGRPKAKVARRVHSVRPPTIVSRTYELPDGRRVTVHHRVRRTDADYRERAELGYAPIERRTVRAPARYRNSLADAERIVRSLDLE